MQQLIDAYLRSPGLANEGRIPWMYLDTAGLVTVGIGCMLADSSAAVALPFRRVDGSASTPAEVEATYNRVHAMPAARLASFYRLPLVLNDAAIDTLASRKIAGFVAQLDHLFPSFDQFPQPAQLALVDMAFNLGVGRAAQGANRATGLQSFSHLCDAVRAHDWTACAGNCDRNRSMRSFDARNAWTRAQFAAAARS